MDQLLPLFGMILIVAALIQFGLWTGRGLRLRQLENKKFDVELDRLRAEIFEITNGSKAAKSNSPVAVETSNTETESVYKETKQLTQGDWEGFRRFKVVRLIQETKDCTSVYLVPEDGLPIVSYLAGQHLTLKFPVRGQAKPPIRCYTLSDAPNDAYYRISVKRCFPPRNNADAPPGLVSYYVNGDLKEGDFIQVKSPSGSFYVQPGNDALVLLAGGIGITPMLSIINTIAQSGSGRECLLVYGVGNQSDHAFKKHFEDLASKHPNIHVLTCYCNPDEADRANIDYQVKGFISVDVLKKVLPGNNFDFYLCGPPPFMQSLFDGLTDWGVSENRIRYEAFGPATVKKSKPESTTDQAAASTAAIDIAFSQSNQNQTWTGTHENLLEFMEEHDIPVDSGCRAGSCGTCQTRLLKGQVEYDDPDSIECEAGYCLPCVAKPTEAIEIDA